MGRTYARNGEFENAIGAFEEAIRIDGNKTEYYGELGQVYLSEGYTRKTTERRKQAKRVGT
jgi:cytochrome c-type biogenesis protein CcmH/NrfG